MFHGGLEILLRFRVKLGSSAENSFVLPRIRGRRNVRFPSTKRGLHLIDEPTVSGPVTV